MIRYLITILFTLGIIALYQFIEIRFFSFDLTRQLNNHLFQLRANSKPDETILILNIGQLSQTEVLSKIDSLLLCKPAAIGINLCFFKNNVNPAKNNHILFADCDNDKPGSLSQIITEGNIVTHFNCTRDDYFEFQLTNFTKRGNAIERISYLNRNHFYKGELKDIGWWFNSGILEDKIVLVGYLGDYITDSIYYFSDTRITPFNPSFGQQHISPDMYDTEISANIIRTIINNDFINEIPQLPRILVLLILSLINVAVISLAKTRWLIVNLVIASCLFMLLNGIGSFLIAYSFLEKGWYFHLDELSLILLITTIFTFVLNISANRAKPNQSIS